MNKELAIHLGLLAPTIAQQLRKQGFRYSLDKARTFQRNSTMISEMWLADLVTDAEKTRMHERLFRKIRRHVVQMNRPKKAPKTP